MSDKFARQSGPGRKIKQAQTWPRRQEIPGGVRKSEQIETVTASLTSRGKPCSKRHGLTQEYLARTELEKLCQTVGAN